MFAAAVFVAATNAWGQAPIPNVDSPSESSKIAENCGALSKFVGCATELATGQPFHVAVASLAPKNVPSATLLSGPRPK